MNTHTLTTTEHQVVKLKLQGLSRKEIAGQLFRSPGTIQRHFQNVYAKIHVQNEIELYNWYLENVLQIQVKKLLQVAIALMLLVAVEVFAPNPQMRTVRQVRISRMAGRKNPGKNYKLA